MMHAEPLARRLLAEGLGSALLTEGLSRCDQEHMPAYLESSNSANAALYQRLGFKALGVIRAGCSPLPAYGPDAAGRALIRFKA